MRFKRSERVGELIHEEISNLLLLGKIKDPRIGFVTVTRVRLSEDLRHARIFVSVMGTQGEKDRTLQGLSSAAGFIRKQVGGKLRLRYLPEIVFQLDNSLEYSARINKVLSELEEE